MYCTQNANSEGKSRTQNQRTRQTRHPNPKINTEDINKEEKIWKADSEDKLGNGMRKSLETYWDEERLLRKTNLKEIYVRHIHMTNSEDKPVDGRRKPRETFCDEGNLLVVFQLIARPVRPPPPFKREHETSYLKTDSRGLSKPNVNPIAV